MDYQIVPKSHNYIMFHVIISLLLIFSLLPSSSWCIVNRDLVLTPKQGLQLSGKRIFYEESYNNDNIAGLLHNNSSEGELVARPWERTLKHVTYLTLFTNAANGIITGNFSKVKEYNDFLASAYERSTNPLDSRFGDIVTLAQGRLETTETGSYKFVEGNCDYECARESNIIAMWHVQKIRHRDTADRKYHYEMKFSVSPITTRTPTETVVRGGPNKRTIMEDRHNKVQTFIQKEDDYPLSFRKLVSDKDEDFTERRYETARNFRQVNQPHYPAQQVTPIPQSTFLRGVYHQPPPQTLAQMQHHQQQQAAHQHRNHHIQQQLPLPERLNIGEFYKGNYVPKPPQKIDLFPNLLNMFMGKPQQQQQQLHHLPQPTTFRPPTYQMKFPRPEIYTLQQHQLQDYPKFPEYHHPHAPPSHSSHEQFTDRSPTPPIVTHHYHHHYFMPNNSAITLEQAIQHSENGEQNQEHPGEIYHNEVTEIATPQGYVTNLYEEQPHASTTLRQQHFPQPQIQTQHHHQSQNHHQLQNQQQLQFQSHHQHQPQLQYHANIQRLNTPPHHHQNYHINQHFPQAAPPPPAPQKIVFPTTQIEQQRVVHVTPAPPLKKPQYQSQQLQQNYETRPFSGALEYTTVHVPLLISYPALINEEEKADIPTPRNKPFIQSDPLEDIIHYSEPDPLYAHDNDAEIGHANKYITNEDQSQQADNQEPQLESPQQYEQSRNNHHATEDEHDNKKEHSESIEAQLPAPSKKTTQNEENKTPEETKENIPEQNTSQTTTTIQVQVKDKDKPTTAKSIKTEASNSLISATKRPKIFALRNKRINAKTTTTTTTTTTTLKPNTTSSIPKTSTTAVPKTSTTIKPQRKFISTSTTTVAPKTSTTSKPERNFISTSSTESPLKIISRYRNSYSARTSSTSTTTTEKPVLKWTPKRKFNHNKFTALKSTTPAVKEIKKEIPRDNENNKEIDNNEENVTIDNDNEDINTNESNNLRITKPPTINQIPSTTTEMLLETTTEMSNAITTGTTSTMSSLISSSSVAPTPSPLLAQTTQDDEEIYEVLTQKSVSKSVSLKVGYNGQEIPVIVDDEENEVKKV